MRRCSSSETIAAAAFAARLAEALAGSPHDADPAAIERLIGRLWAEELARHADKAPRTLKRITLEDAVRADEIFTLLMGEKVEPRREYIERNADKAMNLDY